MGSDAPGRRANQRGRVHGFQTGDIVKAIVPTGKKQGTYVGRVAVRATGSFNIRTATGVVEGISHRYCHLLHHTDGYAYSQKGERWSHQGGASPRPSSHR